METPEDSDRLRKQKQREARRRKILANAGSRMDRLRNMNRGHRFSAQTTGEVNGDVGVGEVPASSEPPPSEPGERVDWICSPPVSDPPDELIPQLHPFPPSGEAPDGRAATFLSSVVAMAQSGPWFRLRTVTAILCALVVTVLNHRSAWSPTSCVITLFTVEVCILSSIAFAAAVRSSSSIYSNPLGKLAVAKLALMYLQPSMAALFERVCLILCLVGIVLRDLCTTLVSTVLFVSLLTLAS